MGSTDRYAIFRNNSVGTLGLAETKTGPSKYLTYAHVPSLDDALKKVNATGGKVVGQPQARPGGRYVSVVDPLGAELGLWEGQHDDHFGFQPGGPRWFELRTTNMEKSLSWYSNITGWKYEPRNQPSMELVYWHIFASSGRSVGGAMMDKSPDQVSDWSPYFEVDDVDGVTERAKGLGATVCLPPMDIPGTGRLSGLVSPAGLFYVMKFVLTEESPKPPVELEENASKRQKDSQGQPIMDHVSVGTSQYDRARVFYDALAKELGWKAILDFPQFQVVGYGRDFGPEFWLGGPGDRGQASVGNGTHFAFRTDSREQVDSAYKVVMAHGATDRGAPGPRPDYGPAYYGAFFADLDGNRLELVWNDETKK